MKIENLPFFQKQGKSRTFAVPQKSYFCLFLGAFLILPLKKHLKNRVKKHVFTLKFRSNAKNEGKKPHFKRVSSENVKKYRFLRKLNFSLFLNKLKFLKTFYTALYKNPLKKAFLTAVPR